MDSSQSELQGVCIRIVGGWEEAPSAEKFPTRDPTDGSCNGRVLCADVVWCARAMLTAKPPVDSESPLPPPQGGGVTGRAGSQAFPEPSAKPVWSGGGWGISLSK